MRLILDTQVDTYTSTYSSSILLLAIDSTRHSSLEAHAATWNNLDQAIRKYLYIALNIHKYLNRSAI